MECDGFKELDEGLQLYDIDDSTSGKEVIGYMPHDRVTYILPDEDYT